LRQSCDFAKKASSSYNFHFTFLLFFLICLGCLIATPAYPDAFYTYGYSPRGLGMVNALAATADDWAAAYYNPAGIAFQTKPSIGIGYFGTASAIDGIGRKIPALEPTNAVLFGATLPIPFKSKPLKDRFTFGVAGFIPNGIVDEIGVAAPSEPDLTLLENSSRVLFLEISFGIRIINGLAIGGGFQPIMKTAGELHASIDANGNIQTKAGEELKMLYYPHGGIFFKPGEIWDVMKGWGFGFVFHSESYTKYTFPIKASLGNIPFIVNFNAVSLYIPYQYVFGVSYAWKRWIWEADVSYDQWSLFPDPNLTINTIANIPVLPIKFVNSIPYDPHFHDTVVPRLGMEVNAYQHPNFDLLVRGGYSFEKSPVPPQNGYTNQLDTDRHIFGSSVGVKWYGLTSRRFEVPIIFDFGAQVQYLVPRVFYKDESVSIDNLGYPRIGMKGFLFGFGVTLSTYFDYE